MLYCYLHEVSDLREVTSCLMILMKMWDKVCVLCFYSSFPLSQFEYTPDPEVLSLNNFILIVRYYIIITYVFFCFLRCVWSNIDNLTVPSPPPEMGRLNHALETVISISYTCCKLFCAYIRTTELDRENPHSLYRYI